MGERMTKKDEDAYSGQSPQLPPLFEAIRETLTNNCDCKVCKTIRKTLIKYGEKHNVEEVIKLKQRM